MLANILKNMYVDPALLAELDEEQKSVLFLKMREEQVRRWREREEQLDQEPVQQKQKKKSYKAVSILLGKDGNPWTWVMGDEDSNDTASTKPNGIAFTPVNGCGSTTLRQSSLVQLSSPSRLEPKIRPIVEVRPMPLKEDTFRPCSPSIEKEFPGCSSSVPNSGLDYRLHEIIRNVADLSTSPVQPDKEKWLQDKLDKMRAGKEPSSLTLTSSLSPPVRHEVFRSCPNVSVISTSSAQSSLGDNWNSAEEEAAWRDQERRAKEADAQRRQTAKNAREEIKRSPKMIASGELRSRHSSGHGLNIEGGVEPLMKPQSTETTSSFMTNGDHPKPPIQPKPSTIKPPVPPKNIRYTPNRVGCCAIPLQATSRSKDAKVFERPEVELWFTESQLQSGALSENGQAGQVAHWFHGFLSRLDAERILEKTTEGSFLVRVHDRIKGYVVSYRSPEKVKHFLVDASQPCQVQFFGANQLIFATIVDLVQFHMNNPVSVTGNELLRKGVPLLEDKIEDVTIRL